MVNEHLDDLPELNITPLVDIMLVLLAILMVTTPALIYEEKITLPNGTKSSAVKKVPELEIRISSDRKVHIKKDTFSLLEFADNFVILKKRFKPDTIVYIKADQSLKYKDVMYVLKSVKEAGFVKISLETNG